MLARYSSKGIPHLAANQRAAGMRHLGCERREMMSYLSIGIKKRIFRAAKIAKKRKTKKRDDAIPFSLPRGPPCVKMRSGPFFRARERKNVKT